MDDTKKLFVDIGCALAILVIGIIGSVLPFFLYSGFGRSLLFQMLSMASGGVMVSAALVHLLAEAMETLEEESDFPLGPFLCGVGFFATLIVDQIAEAYSISHGHSLPKTSDPATEPLSAGADESDAAPSTRTASQKEDARSTIPSYSVAVFTAGFLFHCILEGLALGTEDDEGETGHIFLAIAAHKGLAAYALGVVVLESDFNSLARWIIMGTFCLASPAGVMIGYIISTFSDSATSASFSCLASGTFLYIALMEVIPKELEHKQHIALKIVALLVGYLVMTSVAIWE